MLFMESIFEAQLGKSQLNSHEIVSSRKWSKSKLIVGSWGGGALFVYLYYMELRIWYTYLHNN